MKILISWLLLTIEVLVVARLLPGITIDGFFSAVIVALFIGVLNSIVKPFLALVTLPVNILTLGIFSFILNTFLLLIIASLIQGFSIDGFLWGALFNFVLSLTISAVNVVFRK
ncbi:MAG: phage holin family protein [Candidatus Moranbacteria bacterium]|nr:phage holin family protein [Candidatus Moranbacteria bacterium]